MTNGRAKRRTGLSRERIVAAAAVLVDREGPESLSARRLAAELGCEAMSLYHHVANMRGLLDAVVDRALDTIPLPPADAPDPARALTAMTRAYLELARARPHAFRVLGTSRWRTPAELAYQSRLIELLVRAGHKPRGALRASRVLLVYLNGAGLALAGWVLDPDAVPLESAPPSVRKLMKYSTPAELAGDMAAGLKRLTRSVLDDPLTP